MILSLHKTEVCGCVGSLGSVEKYMCITFTVATIHNPGWFHSPPQQAAMMYSVTGSECVLEVKKEICGAV